MSCALTLGKLIEALKLADPKKVVQKGFARPGSWRGVYEELAFEPAQNVTVESMLKHAEAALGATFEGYKGGEYTMNEYTPVHISEYGESYDYLGEFFLWYMLGDPVFEVCFGCSTSYLKPAASNHSKVECLERQLAVARAEEAKKA